MKINKMMQCKLPANIEIRHFDKNNNLDILAENAGLQDIVYDIDNKTGVCSISCLLKYGDRDVSYQLLGHHEEISAIDIICNVPIHELKAFLEILTNDD